jgi:hypothetical protein
MLESEFKRRKLKIAGGEGKGIIGDLPVHGEATSQALTIRLPRNALLPHQQSFKVHRLASP